MDNERDESMAVDIGNEQSNPLRNAEAATTAHLQIQEVEHSESDSDKNLSQYALVQDEDIRSPQMKSSLEADMVISGTSSSQQMVRNQKAGKAPDNSDSTALSKLLFGSTQKQYHPANDRKDDQMQMSQALFMQKQSSLDTVTDNYDDSSDGSISQIQSNHKVQKTRPEQQILSNIENLDPERMLDQMSRPRKVRSKKGKMNYMSDNIESLNSYYNNPQTDRLFRSDPDLLSRIQQNIQQLQSDLERQRELVDNQDDTYSVTTDGRILIDQRQRELCQVFKQKAKIQRTPQKNSSEQSSFKNPNSSGISMMDSVQSFSSEKRSTRSIIDQTLVKLQEPRFDNSKLFQFSVPDEQLPCGFAVQTEASFAACYDTDEFQKLKNSEGYVFLQLGYPLKAEAQFYAEGRVVIKIQLTTQTINHYNVNEIAKKFMQQAHDNGLLQVETSFEIPNEFWLMSEECALGFKLYFEKLKELAQDEGFKIDRQKNFIEWSCKMRKVYCKIFENGQMFIHSFCSDLADHKKINTKFFDLLTSFKTVLNKLKPYDAEKLKKKRAEKSAQKSGNQSKQIEQKPQKKVKSCNFDGLRQKHIFQMEEVHYQPKQFKCFQCGDTMNIQIPHHNMVVIFKDQEQEKDSESQESSNK